MFDSFKARLADHAATTFPTTSAELAAVCAMLSADPVAAGLLRLARAVSGDTDRDRAVRAETGATDGPRTVPMIVETNHARHMVARIEEAAAVTIELTGGTEHMTKLLTVAKPDDQRQEE